jgi:predicted PurR-regulated permease PerM
VIPKRALQDKAFFVLVFVVSLAFAWIVWQFYGAVLWALVAAIVFAPLHLGFLKSMGHRRNLAALATVAVIALMVILPLGLITSALVGEATDVYESIQSGKLNLGEYLQQIFDALPVWLTNLLGRLGLADSMSVQRKVSAAVSASSQFFATQVLNIGQNTARFLINLFVMLYLLFFLLRDGRELTKRIKGVIPLRKDQQRALLEKFSLVIRATVKGNIVVAIVQGILGGLIFWFLDIHAALLWAVLMAFLSLLPAIGSAFIWFPVAIYLLVTDAIWQGVFLIAYGALVIGLIDNFLRPVLVGKDTRMPDYVVLISTLGGIVIFGINGFVLGPLVAAMFITVWDILVASRPMDDNN